MTSNDELVAALEPTPQEIKNALALISEHINRYSPAPQPLSQMGMIANFVLAALSRAKAGGGEDMRRKQIEVVMAALDEFHVLAGRITQTHAAHVLDRLAALQQEPR